MKPDEIFIIIYWSAVIATLVALMLASISIAASARQKQEPKRTITIVKCYSCGYTIERDYKPGDYIGKEDQKCPKCGAQMYVDAIYVVTMKTKRKLLALKQPIGPRKE
ncbi:MAG: hypothetical protein ABWW69_01845 [Pyrodictiaceae archaeon]